MGLLPKVLLLVDAAEGDMEAGIVRRACQGTLIAGGSLIVLATANLKLSEKRESGGVFAIQFEDAIERRFGLL